MTEQLSSIFNNSPHLTRTETIDYIGGKLSGSELRRVELHLADCEFCSDAVEGLRMMKAEEAEKILDETNEAIQKSIQPEKESQVLIRRWLAAAAVFLALVVSSFFINYYLHNEKTEIAQEIKRTGDTLKKTNSAGNEISELSKTEDLNSGLANEKNIQKNESKDFKPDPKSNKESETLNPVSNEIEALDEKYLDYTSKDKIREEQSAPSPKTTDDLETGTVSETTVTTKNNADAAYSSAPVMNEEVLSKKEKQSKSPMAEANEDYNKKDYNSALKKYKKTLSIDKNNAEANYFAGMSEMKLKQYDNAISYFNLVLSNPGSPYLVDAQWQKALTLIAKDDKQSAQLLLNQIISESGIYKDSAQQKAQRVKVIVIRAKSKDGSTLLTMTTINYFSV